MDNKNKQGIPPQSRGDRNAADQRRIGANNRAPSNTTRNARPDASGKRMPASKREYDTLRAEKRVSAPEKEYYTYYEHGETRHGSHHSSHGGNRHGSHSAGHHGTNGRGYSSRRKSSKKKYVPNTTLLMIIASGTVAVAVFLGVFINHIKNNRQVPQNEETGENTHQTDGGNDVFSESELYNLDEAEVHPEFEFSVARIYDKDGKLIISPVREKTGDINGYLWYEYGEDGNVTVEKKFTRSGILTYKSVAGGKEDGIFKTLYETEFDAKNNYSGYTETQFDENGVVKLKVECSVTGVVEGKYDYEYDESGRIIRENRYTTYGDLSVYSEYKYDAFGNNTEIIQCDSSGKEVLRDVKVYDSASKLILEESYTVGVKTGYTEYTYDKDGNQYKKSYTLVDEHTMTYQEIPG